MTDTAIILAGGLGLRLRSVVKNIPKPMAQINGKPFLYYLLEFLLKNKIKNVVLSVGYKREIIYEYFGENFKSIKISYSNENEPLGTGGAIKKALKLIDKNAVFVINGDTYFDIPLKILSKVHIKKNSMLTIAVKKVDLNDRYDTVLFNNNNRITGFGKSNIKDVFINGGISLLNTQNFQKYCIKNKFSYEDDFIQQFYLKERFYIYKSESYFIDIGIPESYKNFQVYSKSFFNNSL